MCLESHGERPPCHCPKMSAMPSAPISPRCGRGSTNRDSLSRRCSSACGAPHRPFSNPGVVTKIARRALDRAGVITFASRGAHVFRHSQATALLRGGASLEVIASLLRHASLNTTMVYAKTDTVMLQEVAQPWVGGGAQ